MSSNDHSTRQVLPLSAAVNVPRFRRRDWERSAQVREILDSFNLPQTPKPERTVDHSESIIMHGSEILNTLRTGAHVVKQRRTSDHLPTLPVELEVEPFETVADTTLQADAATALAAINDRKPHARRSVRPERATTDAPWTASTVLTWTLLVGSALVAAGWLYLALYR
jgi:hypothetical protein